VILALFNAALAGALQQLAPAQPKLTDRAEYEYAGRELFAPNCPFTIYCYRVLVPAVLERVPIDSNSRWRVFQWLSHTATGTILGAAVAPIGSPLMASLLTQTSYGFTFTAYDPYSPDPFVFLVSAITLYMWIAYRAVALVLLASIAVFAKETAALIVSAPAIAAVAWRDRPAWVRWILPAAFAWTILLSFHWYMDTYRGWGIAKNPAASFGSGSWLAIWWKMNPSLARKALMLFAPFGFAWIFAALGWRHAPKAFQQLAAGAILPMLALVYVQTPERALSNAFFVVIPLAGVFLARVPSVTAWIAAATSGLVTARIGLSSELLPPTTVMLPIATIAALWAIRSRRS
jgi:hypothetical protein